MFKRLLGFASRFGGAGNLRTAAPHIQAVAAHNSYRWADLAGLEAQGRAYQASTWVYVAVNRIAEAGALVPLHVYRLEGERRIEVERHPLEALLDSPNPYLSRFELFEQTLGMLELTGNAYWLLSGDARSVPAEIWPLRPDRVSIVPDEREYVRGYVYEIDGLRIPLDAAEVVHFRRWHPANDYYGLSAVEAARIAISTDRAMAEWNRNTFGRDNGVPAGIVSVREFVSDSDFERIKREWRASYGGPQRRTAFLRGGDIQWHDIGLSHSELDFLKGRQANRDEILNIFGVPVGLISENATEANAKVAERTFIERTLWPKLVRLSQKITQELLPFWPGEHVAEFEDIRPTDTQERMAEIRAAYPVLSVNEIRERYFHLPPVGWGERPAHARRGESVTAQTVDSGGDESAPEEAETPQATKSALEELGQWERFALKRLGRAGGRAFEVRMIPDEAAFEISAGLLGAGDDADAVRAVFAAARESLAE
jgi:HK97 family phage portal protein